MVLIISTLEKYINADHIFQDMKNNKDKVYKLLKKTEPQTPSEIAEQVGLNQKTVQTILFDLTNEKKDVKMKKIGRYRLFWKI